MTMKITAAISLINLFLLFGATPITAAIRGSKASRRSAARNGLLGATPTAEGSTIAIADLSFVDPLAEGVPTEGFVAVTVAAKAGKSEAPTDKPSLAPSASPSLSSQPSDKPSLSPSTSSQPSSQPSLSPSVSSQPSDQPSLSPSISTQPSSEPSLAPSVSSQPSDQPSLSPSISTQPSDEPSLSPSTSSQPSSNPSTQVYLHLSQLSPQWSLACHPLYRLNHHLSPV